MTRRHFMTGFGAAILGATLLTGVSGAALAQGAPFPTKPVKIIVPFAPGGTSDVLARAIGQKLSVMWSQPVVIENRPGAGGNIGAEMVARAPADGHTLLMIDVGTLTISPSVIANLSYDPLKDLAPVSVVAFSPHALVVHPSLPVKSVKELIAHAKANPGSINFANPGNGTLIQLAAEQFREQTGIAFTQVPYKGGAQALVGMIGGEVNMTLNGMLATLPHIKSGKLRPLAVAAAKRSEALPDVPTLDEAGVAGFQSGSWQGLLTSGGTPKEVVAKIHGAVIEVLKAPEIRQQLANQGADVLGNTPEEFAASMKADHAKWAKIVKDVGIKPE
jgi:tripartite-type tricarboxylate transporter receptor subunit TctC